MYVLLLLQQASNKIYFHTLLNSQLTSNGYFSFAREAHLHSPVLFPESTFYNYLVAPYWMNFDIRQSGRISYEVHNTFTSLMSLVNNYIQQQDDEDFVGTWMMIANFKEAPQDGSVENRVNYTFNLRLNIQLTCELISMSYSLDKQFSRQYHHKWKSILCCVHLSLWCFIK